MTLSLPQLPSMRCDRGCGECCGPVYLNTDEYARVARVVKARGIKPIRQGITCPLYIDGQCSVYEARPLICKLYGHDPHPMATCPRGYNANATDEVLQPWRAALRRGGPNAPRATLHALVYSEREFMDIMDEYLASGTPAGNGPGET